MGENYRGYDLNVQGDQPPWGTIENTLFKQIIDKIEDGGTVPLHNALDGLQGDSATERYHITVAQKTMLDSIEVPYTIALDDKLGGIEVGAQVNVGVEYTQTEKDKLAGISGNPISAQITSPTLAELQALVDSGVTVFYAGSDGGVCELPSGTLQLKGNTYYFIGGSFENGGFLLNGNSLGLNFTTPSGANSVVFSGSFNTGNSATLTISGNPISSTFETLTVGGDCTLDIQSQDFYVETISYDTAGAPTLTVLGNELVYQYIKEGLTFAGLSRQENWLRPKSTATQAEPKTITADYANPTNGEPLFVETSTTTITLTLDDATDNSVVIPITKITDINTPDVLVTTDGGTQLIGGKTSQLIGGESEGITVRSYGDRYEIVQDSRDKTRNRLTGVLENKNYIAKVDENNILINEGSAKIKKSDGSIHKVIWDSIPVQPVTISSGRLQWVVFKWNAGETDIELAFYDLLPSDLHSMEETALIGRIWRVNGTLFVGDRHIMLSDDPYVSRNSVWIIPSTNVSVETQPSTTDVNLISLTSGELSRYPTVEADTRHHIFPFGGDDAVSTMWEHLQSQTAFSVLTDNAVGDETDIKALADYYDSDGTITILPNSKFGAHLVGVYAGSDIKVLFRSQYVYDSISDAKLGISSDPLMISDWASDMNQISKIGWLIVKKGVRDYSNPSDAVFIPYSLAGGGSGGGSSAKEFSFRFSRVELSGYGGGDVDLPYVTLAEANVTQTLPDYLGVDSSAPSTITGVQFQNGQVAPVGGIEVYIKVDGVRSVIGTVPSGERTAVFETNISLLADQFVLFGFNAQAGSYPSPTVSAYITTLGL